MAVANSELQLRYTGTAGTAATSLGGAPSTTQIGSPNLHNIFDEVSGDESSAGDINFRIIVFHNASSQEAKNVHLHFEANHDSGDQSGVPGITNDQDGDISLAIGSALNTNPTAITNEDTAPTITGSWNNGTTRATGIDLGDVPGGQFRGVALRRVIADGAPAADAAEFQIRITADTGE